MAELKYFVDLLLFPNRREEKMATYFSYTNGFLWRRDKEHLVAYRFPKKILGDWTYPIGDFKQFDGIKELKVDNEGMLVLSLNNGENKKIPSINVPFESNSIKTLFVNDPTVEFTISSKFLSRQLSTFQRKILNQNLDLEKIEIKIDLKNKLLTVLPLNESKTLPVNVLKGNSDQEMTYSFPIFKDLFINANKFDEKITFKTKAPYFTVVRYNSNLYSVLTHKKDSPQ